MYRYTICFLKHRNGILMLNRNKSPLMGLWNGVGGKLEHGETPLDSVLREVREETGILLETACYKGIVSWRVDGVETGGMYAFLAHLPEDYERSQTPQVVEEGILDWKELAWVLDPDNAGVPENLPTFLPYMLEEDEPCQHIFTYENSLVVNYETASLPKPVTT
ncbi:MULTISPECIES: 8-oxo-dGTP diphosphatase [Brevibacillus]|uniref:NUDIX hydrolase n=1 Tax=Brevibacillus TaxID=55080 RepID=UPI000B36EC3A|nr:MULTISPECIES: 8-oxo-dGTP diphosphatase [Brevibacillus]NRS46855.1 8-oxo-dGTP diphosphatase [Brevibacillus sp. HB2.2]OUQ85594.1 DNA mismatch repair protein MutT [Brevibacillus brevis]